MVERTLLLRIKGVFSFCKIFFKMCNLNSLYSVSEEYLTYGTTAIHMASENGHAAKGNRFSIGVI